MANAELGQPVEWIEDFTPPPLDALLEARRRQRYGSFEGHAEVTQDLKRTVNGHLARRAKELSDVQREALEMICHKIGRIINGDPNYDDSWVDIAGYATRVVEHLRGEPT